MYFDNECYSQVGTKVDDYWEAGRTLLQDPGKFLEILFQYDRDNIPDSVIQKIQPYIDNEDFTPAAIAKVALLPQIYVNNCWNILNY